MAEYEVYFREKGRNLQDFYKNASNETIFEAIAAIDVSEPELQQYRDAVFIAYAEKYGIEYLVKHTKYKNIANLAFDKSSTELMKLALSGGHRPTYNKAVMLIKLLYGRNLLLFKCLKEYFGDCSSIDLSKATYTLQTSRIDAKIVQKMGLNMRGIIVDLPYYSQEDQIILISHNASYTTDDLRSLELLRCMLEYPNFVDTYYPRVTPQNKKYIILRNYDLVATILDNPKCNVSIARELVERKAVGLNGQLLIKFQPDIIALFPDDYEFDKNTILQLKWHELLLPLFQRYVTKYNLLKHAVEEHDAPKITGFIEMGAELDQKSSERCNDRTYVITMVKRGKIVPTADMMANWGTPYGNPHILLDLTELGYLSAINVWEISKFSRHFYNLNMHSYNNVFDNYPTASYELCKKRNSLWCEMRKVVLYANQPGEFSPTTYLRDCKYYHYYKKSAVKTLFTLLYCKSLINLLPNELIFHILGFYSIG